MGEVEAGEPLLAEENIEEYLELPDMIGGEEGDDILRVKGDSMKDAGILAGDYVVVKQTDDATNGEIVVALLEHEATVKRFFREKHQIRLEPETPPTSRSGPGRHSSSARSSASSGACDAGNRLDVTGCAVRSGATSGRAGPEVSRRAR